MRLLTVVPLLLLSVACASTGSGGDALTSPIAGGERVDHLIQDGERHFAALWKLTSGGENAEGYWSFDGTRLSLQRRNSEEGVDCDRIYVTGADGELHQLSDGVGVTTCAHFLPGDREVVYASTRGGMQGCPPPPDHSMGYVWMLHPEYDLWVRPVAGPADAPARQLTETWGYDAEATVSPLGDRMVFTSTRSGDVELWTADLDGKGLFQVTDAIGYDGGGFFSHDGQRIVFRSTHFADDPDERVTQQRAYADLLAANMVRPGAMDLYVINADGTGRTQVTDLGGASFAPYFYPSDTRIVFSTNHKDPRGRDFDLYAIDTDGSDLERITTYEGFDCFPMFSPDGEWFVFASNRGGEIATETNLFVAKWRD